MPRKPGSLNKVTKETREVLAGVLDGQLEHIQGALLRLRDGREEQYLHAISRLLPYILPKAKESLNIEMTQFEPGSWFDD